MLFRLNLRLYFKSDFTQKGDDQNHPNTSSQVSLGDCEAEKTESQDQKGIPDIMVIRLNSKGLIWNM